MKPLNKKISVHDFASRSITKVRNKIILVGGLVVLPMMILVGFYSEYSSLSQTMIPVTRQMAQSISLGDEIALQRITDSLALIPQVSAVHVYLEDGTCAAESKSRESKETWSPAIQEPCQLSDSPFELSMSRDIKADGAPAKGKVRLSLRTPWNYVFFLPLVFFFIVLVANLFIKLSIQNTVLSFVRAIDSLSSVFDQKKKADFEFSEIDEVYRKLLKLKELELEIATNESLQKAASQVSHDIRSPLSALEMILPSLEELPEQKRLIVRHSVNRIRDIANDLLRKYRITKSLEPEIDERAEVELLMPLIESIVSEKRLEFRKLKEMEIVFGQSEESYGLFSSLSANDLKRALSNLLNNAIEALPGGIGKVIVSLTSENGRWILVTVTDNGTGMSKDQLQKVGARGVSIDKQGGSGLGLSGAIEIVKRWGGDVILRSEKNQGTSVVLKLRRSETPSWFVSKIELEGNSTVIVLDDDLSIHRIWQGRLDSLHAQYQNVSLKCFSSTTEVQSYYRDHFADLDGALFLIDFEIVGSSENGIDLIERLGIQKQAILVTSRYEESSVRERCERLGIRLIPKSMSGFVPIEIVEICKSFTEI